MGTKANHRFVRAAAVVTLAAALTPLSGPGAQAADAGERGWNSWILTNGAWSGTTPQSVQAAVKQGDVFGFRYSAAKVGQPRPPRDVTATFEKLCAKQKTDPGQVAVGYLIDYGRAADSASGQEKTMKPRAGCTVVPEGTPLDGVLRSVADVRTGDKDEVCGVDSYPATGCTEKVADLKAATAADDKVAAAVAEPGAVAVPASNITQPPAAPTATAAKPEEGTDTGPQNWVLALIAVALFAAIAAGAWLARRRMGEDHAARRAVGHQDSRPAHVVPRTGATRQPEPDATERHTDVADPERD